MSDLAARQSTFLQAILDEEAPLPDGWGARHAAGMDVYRGNYRSSLMSALKSTYERTARYVGEGPFKRSAIHHLLSHPPSGWTIDEAGEGFDATCAELFGENPEVAEIAWVEWAMLQCTSSPDAPAMTQEDFACATAGFDDAGWMNLSVEFQPRAAARVLDHKLAAIWNALAEDGLDVPAVTQEPTGCIVWREGEQPTFISVEPDNARAFAAMQGGASYGETIELLAGENPDEEAVQSAAMRAGEMLGGWLQEGIIVSVKA